MSHPFVLAYDRAAVPLGEVLDRQVTLLLQAHHAGDPVAAELLRGTGTKGTDEEVLGRALTEEAARLAIALDHGYADWGAARADAGLSVDTRFEAAADAIQWGELTALRIHRPREGLALSAAQRNQPVLTFISGDGFV